MQPTFLNAQVESDAHVAFGGILWLGWKFCKLKTKTECDLNGSVRGRVSSSR